MAELPCPFDPECPGMSSDYPPGYRDPQRRPGERSLDYGRRLFDARRRAVAASMNAHLAGHPQFDGLRLVWEAA
jgi:hypothetical protein